MLLSIRERINGYVAWIIILLISVPFMFWGIQEYFGLGEQNYAIELYGDSIPMSEYEQALVNNRQRLLNSFQGRIPPNFNLNSFVREQTLNQLINRALLDQLFQQDNYRIAAQSVINDILQNPQFQLDGRFDNTTYAANLTAMGLSKKQYESLLATQLLNQQFIFGIEQSEFISPAELANLVKQQYQTRSFDYFHIPVSAYQTVDPITAEAIAAYYAANKAELLTTETVRVQYIELQKSALATEMPVTEAQLQQLYQDALAAGGYQTEEIRNADHILIEVPANASAAITDAKRAEAEAILAELKQGADFAELAKTKSADIASAEQGGALGDIERGSMVESFAAALFAMSEPGISDIVQTQYGFHIIRLNSIKPKEVQPFAAVRTQLLRSYQQEAADTAFREQVELLANLVFENPDSLTPAAEALDISIQTSEPFANKTTNQGIAQYEQVVTAAFSPELLQAGQNSELLELTPEHVVVIRVAEHQPAREQTLEEARVEIVAKLTEAAVAANISSAAEALLQELANNPDKELTKLAESYQASYQTVTDAKRQPQGENKIPLPVIQRAFTLPNNLANEQPVTTFSLANGDYAVLRLLSSKDGDLQWLTDSESKMFAQRITQARSRYAYNAILMALRDEANLKINPDLTLTD